MLNGQGLVGQDCMGRCCCCIHPATEIPTEEQTEAVSVVLTLLNKFFMQPQEASQRGCPCAASWAGQMLRNKLTSWRPRFALKFLHSVHLRGEKVLIVKIQIFSESSLRFSKLFFLIASNTSGNFLAKRKSLTEESVLVRPCRKLERSLLSKPYTFLTTPVALHMPATTCSRTIH